MKKIFLNRFIINWYIVLCVLLIQKSITAQAHVYVNPQTVLLSGQSSVTVDFMISNVDSLQSYYISVLFNNSVIAFQNTVKGPFLSIGGNTYFDKSPNPVIDSVQVTEVLFGPNHPPVSGSGKLFSITFSVLSAGSSEIKVDYINLFHQRGNVNIPVTWSSGEVVVPVSLNAILFLQGPFSSSNMTTTLNSSGYLPHAQPYSVTPWNYNGTEYVSAGFFSTHPNIVDWILVELRTGTGANTMIARKVGFITNNGIIVNINGVSSLYFPEPKGNYYMVIYHRNHLPIMSSNSINLDYVSAQYDFTNSQTKAYGTNAMVSLGGGMFGMYSADANGNGQVQNNDSENYWAPQNGQSGYREADFNLNGQVQNNDHELYWVPNNGKGSQVP